MLKRTVTSHIKLIVAVAVIIFCCLIPLFLHSPYYLDILINVIVNAVLAMTFIMILRTGLINMGVTVFWGIGAYASTILVMKAHLNFWFSLPASALISGVMALCLGFVLITRGGFNFIVLTMVLGMLFNVIVGNVEYLGKQEGISQIPPPGAIGIPYLPVLEFVSKVQYFYLALVLLLVVIIISNAFYSSRSGRAWSAIGLNSRLAESIGIDIKKYRILGFVLASFICGLMGSFYAHYQGYIVPATFSMWNNISFQTYAILGGLGHAFVGPLVGSFVMTILPEFMRGANLAAPAINGIILILLVLFLPRGLLSLQEWRASIRERFSKIRKASNSLASNINGRANNDIRG